jgi:hypothetical protein
MKQYLLALAGCVLAAMATASCDKLKPPLPSINPIPKTGAAAPAQEAPAPKAQDPNSSAQMR